MFQSKDHALGGTNDIFEDKRPIPETLPPSVLRYGDFSALRFQLAMGDNGPAMTRTILDRFHHYMSAEFVIVKPPTVDPLQTNMLAQFRMWLTVQKSRFDESSTMTYYTETDRFFTVPRPLALTIFGPAIWLPLQPHNYSSSSNVGGSSSGTSTNAFKEMRGAMAAEDRRSKLLHWYTQTGHEEEELLVDDIPFIKSQFVHDVSQRSTDDGSTGAIRKGKRKQAGDGDAAKKSRVRVDYLQPHIPATPDMPRPIRCIPMLRNPYPNDLTARERKGKSLFVWPPPRLLMTRALRLRARLRESPTDQLQVVAASLVHYRNAFLRFDDEATSIARHTVPSLLLCLPCGHGKTLCIIAIWLWLMRTCFDQFGVKDIESPSFVEKENDYLRVQNEPCRTVKMLFVVHTKSLMYQAAKSINQYVEGGVRIGILEQDDIPDPRKHDVVVASIDTIAARDHFDLSYFDNFPFVVSDEAHQDMNAFIMRALRKINSPYRMALTATPRFWMIGVVLGAVLIYISNVYKSQHTNMIAYGVGTQKERKRIVRSKSSQEMTDMAGQIADIVVDHQRNAWLTHCHMSPCLDSRLITHGNARDGQSVQVRGLASLLRTTGAKLYRVSRLSEAINTSSTSSVQESTSATLSSEVEIQASLDFLDQVDDADLISVSKPASTFKPVSVVALPSSSSARDVFAVMKGAAAATSALAAAKAASAGSVSPAPTGRTVKTTTRHITMKEAPAGFTVPYDPKRNKRHPIFASSSVHHLTMHQFWHAQYWIDYCTSVPKERLLIVRTNLRQIAVIDTSLLKPSQWSMLKWMSPRGYQQSAADCLSSVVPPLRFAADMNKEVFLKTNFQDKPFVPSFNTSFWEAWFRNFPINETHAKERNAPENPIGYRGIPFPTKSTSAFSKFAKAKKKPMSNTSFTPSSSLFGGEAVAQQKGDNKSVPLMSASITEQMRKAAQSALASATTDSPSQLVDDSESKASTAQKKEPKSIDEHAIMADCAPMNHEGNDFIHHASYWWVPILYPLPEVYKPKSTARRRRQPSASASEFGAYVPDMDADYDDEVCASSATWVDETFVNDKRSEFPILATFGLYMGSYAIPKPLQISKVKQCHMDDALESEFVLGTDKLASTGLDKPILETFTQGTPNTEHEQSDGRCDRPMEGKQVFLKNEFVDPIYSHVAYKHDRSYREQKRTVEYYRIDV